MEAIKALIIKSVPYYKTLGLDLQDIGDGRADFELVIRKELTQNGMVHGGALASLIDSACACAAVSAIFPNGYVTSIDLQVSYLKPVSKGTLTAKAECIKSGKNICFCEAKIWNDQGELVCTGSSQLMRVDRKIAKKS